MPEETWESDDRIGVPVAGAASKSLPINSIAPDQEPRSDERESAHEPELRAGDTQIGRPAQVPISAAPLTTEERQRLHEAEEQQAQRDLAEAEEMLASDPAALTWAGWFAHPLAAAFLIGTIGALGLFLYSQALGILSDLATQPTWVQYPGYFALGLLAFAVCYSMLRLMFLFIRLRRNRQLRLQGLEELQGRTRLRWLAQAKTQEAKTRLEEYVRTYPVEEGKDFKTLGRLGLSPELTQELRTVRDELLNPTRYASAQEWFERFRAGFQGKLDGMADVRVRYWSNRAMLVTAVSPNGLVDSLSTLYFGFAMLNDLCRIYNLKTGRTGTAVLLARVFFNAYLAGQLNDFEKLAEEQYDQLFEQGFQVVGVGMSSNVVGKFLGKVGAKATTGYLNRVLLGRLGRYACRLLRPVTRD